MHQEEQQRLSLEWNLQRTLAKINYRIHTDAIKEQIVPPEVTKAQVNAIYAFEADLLNGALFGNTAGEWCESHPDATGNIRDEATLEQLVVLSNLESVLAGMSVMLLPWVKLPPAMQLLSRSPVWLLKGLLSKRLGCF